MYLGYGAIAGVAALAVFAQVASASAPTSFCKCTCFSNSTIIPLNAPVFTGPDEDERALFLRSSSAEQEGDDILLSSLSTSTTSASTASTSNKHDTPTPEPDEDRKEYRAGNCNDCNRQFCLDYNLPICKKASMEDVFTTCFQRDSRKDQAVVLIFIIATVGLLGWAAIRPWFGRWFDTSRGQRSYNVLPGTD